MPAKRSAPPAQPAEAILSVIVHCESCGIDSGKRRQVQDSAKGRHDLPPIFLMMAPGRDGVPWFLCLWCWFEGLHPNDPRPTRPHVIV
jgi:hypothetical protein